MKLGIRSKLFLSSLVLVTFLVGLAYVALSAAFERMLTDRIREDLAARVDLIERDVSGAGLQADDAVSWAGLAGELGQRARARVTIISRDGTVLADSQMSLQDLARIDNHAGRPEVLDALRVGRGHSTRFSESLRQRMMYAAVPFRRKGVVAGVVRAAVPLAAVDLAHGELRRIFLSATLVGILATVVLSAAAATFMARNLRILTAAARRMVAGDLAVRTQVAGKDEVATLGRTLDQLAESLSLTLAELKTERDLLSGILEGMQEGVLLLDPSDRIALLNPALRDMLLLPADSVGKPTLEVVRNAELKDLLDRARTAGRATGEIELSGIKPRRLLVHAAGIADKPGRLLAVFVDVTDLRRLESLRRDFVANVSHELRTPVAAVRSAAETLRGAAANDPQAAIQFADMIERNAERLQRLVEDLLDLSRIESRAYRLNLEPVVAQMVVRHALSLFHDRAEKKRLVLSAPFPEDLPPLKADRRALEQVTINLIDNAIKYCPEGTGITVSAEVLPPGTALPDVADPRRPHARLFVRDNGPGIEQKHLSRLFERFYRVDAGRSREVGGTGLGLSIVKHLVEAMGGSVAVESQMGRGATFSCILPVWLPDRGEEADRR